MVDRALASLVRSRAGDRCEYGRIPEAYDSPPCQIDHIVAQQHGGPTTSENLALACFSCNCHKGPNLAGIDPETGAVGFLYHPRRQAWSRHFRWDGPRLVGRTIIGRVTIAVLPINDQVRVTLREVLMMEGVMPGK